MKPLKKTNLSLLDIRLFFNKIKSPKKIIWFYGEKINEQLSIGFGYMQKEFKYEEFEQNYREITGNHLYAATMITH